MIPQGVDPTDPGDWIDLNDTAGVDPTDPGDWIDYNDTAGVDPTDPGDWIDLNDTAGVDPTDPGDWIDFNDTAGVDPTDWNNTENPPVYQVAEYPVYSFSMFDLEFFFGGGSIFGVGFTTEDAGYYTSRNGDRFLSCSGEFGIFEMLDYNHSGYVLSSDFSSIDDAGLASVGTYFEEYGGRS